MTRDASFRLLVLGGLLVAFQFFVNQPVLGHGWVYFDDDINILLNPHLSGFTADSLHWAWTDFDYTRRYMPLGWMLFDGLFRLGGLNPVIYHAASWLLAAANTLLLFFLARKFLGTGQPGRPAGAWRDFAAALAVAWLAVHPLRAETVGWASALLYLASTGLGTLAVLVSWPGEPGASARRAWPGPLLFLLSLLVYPTCLGLPLILLLLAAMGRFPFRRCVPWLVIALAAGLLSYYAAAYSRAALPLVTGVAGYPPGARLAHAAELAAHYAGRIFWPGATSPYYGAPAAWTNYPAPHWIAWGALIVGGGLLLLPRTRRATAGALGLFIATLLPFLGLLDQHQVANDRYAFLLLAVAAVGLAGLLARLPPGPARPVAAAVLLALIALTCPLYRDALAVWQDTDHVQARLETVTAAVPNAQLNYARPAIQDFLFGRYAASRRRVSAGLARLGPQPDLVAAAQFIEETRAKFDPNGGDPSIAPCVVMQLDLAQAQQALGHARAATAHLDFAHQLARQTGRDLSLPPAPAGSPHP